MSAAIGPGSVLLAVKGWRNPLTGSDEIVVGRVYFCSGVQEDGNCVLCQTQTPGIDISGIPSIDEGSFCACMFVPYHGKEEPRREAFTFSTSK